MVALFAGIASAVSLVSLKYAGYFGRLAWFAPIAASGAGFVWWLSLPPGHGGVLGWITTITWLGLWGMLAALAVIDARVFLLPNSLMWPSFAVTLTAILLGWFAGQQSAALRALLAGTVGLASFAFFAMLSRGALGWGDVKYALPLGAVTGWCGSTVPVLSIFCAVLLGGAVAIVVLVKTRDRKQAVPFGPMMYFGCVLGVGLMSGAGL